MKRKVNRKRKESKEKH